MKTIDPYTPEWKRIIDLLEKEFCLPPQTIRFKIEVEMGEPIRVVDLDYYPPNQAPQDDCKDDPWYPDLSRKEKPTPPPSSTSTF